MDWEGNGFGELKKKIEGLKKGMIIIYGHGGDDLGLITKAPAGTVKVMNDMLIISGEVQTANKRVKLPDMFIDVGSITYVIIEETQ